MDLIEIEVVPDDDEFFKIPSPNESDDEFYCCMCDDFVSQEDMTENTDGIIICNNCFEIMEYNKGNKRKRRS